ncbi:uncharacterized protein OCT59_025778 [Rhizophagus irregularis]|nr:hypothetical protein OCT59_025778 [Rhizophagus irregularis]GBC11043.2 hypothetical protein GLOIN_2v1786607 [Rhizophagus irregularis DAOM 181602=DAOM 197198]
MNTQSLSSNDKGLLTKLSQNNETTIVSNNNAYFKGNFYEKKNNEWVDSDLNEFTKILNAESFFDDTFKQIVRQIKRKKNYKIKSRGKATQIEIYDKFRTFLNYNKVNVEDDIEIFEEFSGFQKVLEEFEIKIKIGNILDILNNRSKAKSCVKRKWQVCDIGPSYLLDIKNEKWDELLKELNIENIEESDNDEDV